MKRITDADLNALSSFDRLSALARYDLTDPDLVAELDAIAASTAERLRQPIAMTNLMLDSAAVVRGSYGLDGYGDAVNVPIEWSFCVRAVRSGRPQVVPDMSRDPEEHDNPLVVHQGVRSYAGVPLSTPDGQVIGTHCVIGLEPREFTDAELAALSTAAADVLSTLERYAKR
ncbi:GAF domain-containing protein [Cryptosporangium arvum]|uniref:GAF domain-containing protein n=1 Tax=Cryptosporangium arvum TaxID=80871 RepID=UPI0004B58FD7|nr:GAF domain-containing protein [Cryptosporangium arvum]